MSRKRRHDYAMHLEFLGYACKWQRDGWLYAIHPVRWNFFLLPVEGGVRFHCSISIGLLSDQKRTAALEFLNQANQRTVLARFTLEYEAAFGCHFIRARTFLQGEEYERSEFGMWMDLWHTDLESLRGGPWAETDDEEGDEESEQTRAPSTVN